MTEIRHDVHSAFCSLRRPVYVAVLAAGCASGSEKHTAAPATQTAAAAPLRTCLDSIEPRALVCSNGAARRVGDTLFIKLDTAERRMLDFSRGDNAQEFRYVGRIGRARFHVVAEHGYEGPPEAILINPHGGRDRTVIGVVKASPDGERFVTAEAYWNDCEDLPVMEVWRLTDSIPVLDWRLKPNSCETDKGWGAVDPKWRSADTLDFFRSHLVSSAGGGRYGRDPMAAVRDNHGWRLIGDRAHPVENPVPIMPYVSEGECSGSSCAMKEMVACRAFMAQPLMPGSKGTDVIPGDEVRVFGTVLIVDQPGVVVFEGPVSGANGGDALPKTFQRGDSLYLLEHLGGARWEWWWHGRPGSSRLDWLDSTAKVRAGTKASTISEPRYTRWTKIMRMPREPEAAWMTYVKAEPGMWATARDRCRG